MKFTLMNLAVAAIVVYVIYQYFNREQMTNQQTIMTAIGVVVGIVVIGGLAMYATSK